MRTIYATRVSGNVYDVTYSDDRAGDRLNEQLLSDTLVDCKYDRVVIDDRLEGGRKIVHRASYRPDRSLLMQGGSQ